MSSDNLETDKGLLQFERLYAKLYWFLAHQYLTLFKDKKGEAMLRKAIRKYGEHRGRTLRKEHESDGLPVNVYTLFTHGGFPGKAGFVRNQTCLTARKRISETLTCPLYDEWQALGGHTEGLCYCEEIHAAIWSAYDPRIVTVQSKIKTKGDPICTFDVRLEEKEDTHPQEPSSTEPCNSPMNIDEAVARMGDLWAKMYFFLAEGLLLDYGLEGEQALREAIRNYGANRGEELRARHIEAGYSINLVSLFENYDLPDDSRFKRNKIELTTETRISQTLRCPYAEVWEELGHGKNHLAQIYCEEVHHALFGAYARATQTNLCHPLTYEDSDYCMFSVYLRPANQRGETDGA